jgi:hypothetical protein
MLFKLVPAAIFAVACGALSVQAQSVRDIPGPKELPPAGFKAAQYVDSRGCVFVRAGIDGRTVWVPRVKADRTVLCGYPPSFTTLAEAPEVKPRRTEPVAAATAAPQAEALAPRVAQAAPTAQTDLSRPGANPARAGSYVDTPRAGAEPGQIVCPARAPIAQRLPLRGGGSILLCVSREGVLNERASVADVDATLPLAGRASADSVLVCPRAAPVAQSLPRKGGGAVVLCTPGDGSVSALAVPVRRLRAPAPEVEVARAATLPANVPPVVLRQPVVPKGYKLAWQDDRLNPNRGKGTAEGWVLQDRVWTRTVPAELRPQPAAVAEAAPARTAVRVSTKSAPQPGSSSGAVLVQVGSFAQPANAQAASARLAALGLPVVEQGVTRNGKAMRIVYAGPFRDPGLAQAALEAAQRAGFPDALLRRN